MKLNPDLDMQLTTRRFRLLIRADDAGVTRGTNTALLACAEAGLARNIGFMACTPEFEHAASLFRDPPQNVILGLHATVTSEWSSSLRWGPVLPRQQVPSLLDEDGCFVKTTKSLHEQARLDEIIIEIKAQIDRARDCGLKLSYMDTHMVINWIPGLHNCLEDLAQREGLILDDPFGKILSPLPQSDFTEYNIIKAFQNRLLSKPLQENILMLTHPSTFDVDALRMVINPNDDPEAVGRERAKDRELLTHPETLQWIREQNIELITYTDL
jgi:chitin disaccharide deacetylase